MKKKKMFSLWETKVTELLPGIFSPSGHMDLITYYVSLLKALKQQVHDLLTRNMLGITSNILYSNGPPDFI